MATPIFAFFDTVPKYILFTYSSCDLAKKQLSLLTFGLTAPLTGKGTLFWRPRLLLLLLFTSKSSSPSEESTSLGTRPGRKPAQDRKICELLIAIPISVRTIFILKIELNFTYVDSGSNLQRLCVERWHSPPHPSHPLPRLLHPRWSRFWFGGRGRTRIHLVWLRTSSQLSPLAKFRRTTLGTTREKSPGRQVRRRRGRIVARHWRPPGRRPARDNYFIHRQLDLICVTPILRQDTLTVCGES